MNYFIIIFVFFFSTFSFSCDNENNSIPLYFTKIEENLHALGTHHLLPLSIVSAHEKDIINDCSVLYVEEVFSLHNFSDPTYVRELASLLNPSFYSKAWFMSHFEKAEDIKTLFPGFYADLSEGKIDFSAFMEELDSLTWPALLRKSHQRLLSPYISLKNLKEIHPLTFFIFLTCSLTDMMDSELISRFLHPSKKIIPLESNLWTIKEQVETYKTHLDHTYILRYIDNLMVTLEIKDGVFKSLDPLLLPLPHPSDYSIYLEICQKYQSNKMIIPPLTPKDLKRHEEWDGTLKKRCLISKTIVAVGLCHIESLTQILKGPTPR